MDDNIPHLWTIIGIDETQIPELSRLEQTLNELPQQPFNEYRLLNDTDALINILDTLCKNYFTIFKRIDIKKRKLFIQLIHTKLEPIENKLQSYDKKLKALYEQKQLLTNLCSFDFNKKPLRFTKQALRYMHMLQNSEDELINLIDDMRRKHPNSLDDILDKEYKQIKNNRRNKIVITVIGATKSTKSSLINFLLQFRICPTGNKETTARLTKIIYGQKSRVTLINSLDSPIQSYVFDNKEQLQQKAKEFIVLKNEERKSNLLCQDVVQIGLPIDELKNVELWDVPGFDENPVIDERISEILKDTDLILAVLAQQESLRNTTINFIKPCLIQNDNKNKPITKICFIISQIDKFKSDGQSNESKEEFLQHIYRKIREELPTNFPDVNYKSSNQFIPMCSSYIHSVKDHLECRQQFIEKSCKWFNDALHRFIYDRSNLLLKSIKEFSNYDDIFHQRRRYERTKEIVNSRFIVFNEALTENIQLKLNQIDLIMKQSIDEIVAQCLVLFKEGERSENIVDFIRKQLTDKFNEVMAKKSPEIIEMIRKTFVKFSNAIELKPPDEQILKQTLDDVLVEDSYKNIIENYQYTYPYHLSNYFKRICRTLVDGFIIMFNRTSDHDSTCIQDQKTFLTREQYVEEKILESTVALVSDVLDQISHKLYTQTEKTLKDFLRNRFKHILGQLEEKTRRYTNSSIDDAKIVHLQQFFNENLIKIKRIHLNILDVQFQLDYPFTFKINENERLDQNSNFRVFTGTLGQDNLPIAAKLIPLDKFKLQEVLYMRELQHENIIQYYGVKKHTEDQYYIIMPRLDCDLLTYLTENTRKLNSNAVDQMIIQIIQGLNYIHIELELVHRDIKLQNILVDKVKQLFLIADLGGVHQQPITRCYSEGYVAPEILSSSNPGMITMKCDIYSLGIVIREIIRLIDVEQNNNHLIIEWLKISKKCCSQEPSERPSCEKILEIRAKNVQN